MTSINCGRCGVLVEVDLADLPFGTGCVFCPTCGPIVKKRLKAVGRFVYGDGAAATPAELEAWIERYL